MQEGKELVDGVGSKCNVSDLWSAVYLNYHTYIHNYACASTHL